MGNSGKLAIIAAVVSLGLLVLAAAVLEEVVLYLLLGAILTCYLASLIQVFNRRRYLVVLLAAAGTALFIGFGIAFLRMWGLAFNQDSNALGSAVSSKDSDIYFYLAALAGVGTLGILFLGAVLPGFGSRAQPGAARPGKRPAARRPAGSVPAKRPAARPAQGRTTQGRPAQGRPAQPRPAAAKRPNPAAPTQPRAAAPKRPTQSGKAATQAKRPPSNTTAQRKPAPKR
ncbi:hypothetical protein [Paenarthrobacter sp. NPDC018779]|uniref:hypothetical protein n=1 Tax=Paenarthrobacter sp. NPDC018779 TaxID=3364375 RepID=UPI0037C973DB